MDTNLLENCAKWFCFIFVVIIVMSIFGYFVKDTLKSIWDYFFNKWEITIKETGKEQWFKRYSDDVFNIINNRHGKEIPGSDYERNFVVYLHKNKYNKEEKLVKEYLN